MSFFVSAVCGYMAGLIGSSNSPLSGVGILVVIGAALLLVFGVKPLLAAGSEKGLVAFALFVTAVVFAVASIANNNLQDLKTGQLVDATPCQAAVGAGRRRDRRRGGDPADPRPAQPRLRLRRRARRRCRRRALAAPQAGLISALAQGVIQNNIDWSLIGIGARDRRRR